MTKNQKLFNLVCAIGLVFFFVGCKTDTVANSNNDTEVSGLMIELLRPSNSILIVDSNPEYSWIVPAKAKKQTAFQILVATTKQQIEQQKGDFWDSGKVGSEASSNVEHKGTSFTAGTTYYWSVKVWGAEDWESEFSKIHSFTYQPATNKQLTSQNIFQIDTILPNQLHAIDEHTYFIDFGKAAFSNLVLHYETSEADTLQIHLGEQVIDGRVNIAPQGSIRYQMVSLAVDSTQTSYHLAITPDKRNTKPRAIALPDSFPVLMPFRYAEIEGMKSLPKKEQLEQLAYHSYFENDASYFSSSDSLLNQVWDLCKYSIKATTFAGPYVDGDRERIPYEADAYLNQLSHYTTDREYSNARLTIEYFMGEPTWPTEWQLHVAMMFYQDYMYTGNAELLEKYFEPLRHKTLIELAREDGLISSSSPNMSPEFMNKLGFTDPKITLKDIVDWPPAQKDTGWELATAEGERDGFEFKPVNTVVNCFHYENMRMMSEMAAALNNESDKQLFKKRAALVKNAINTKLFDKEKGIYIDGEGSSHSSLHSNMMALAFDIVPEEHVSTVVAFVKSRGMACSVYGAQYLLEGLYNAGEAAYALQLMTATHDRSWYNMMRVGSTISMEAWDMKYKPNSDWNHAWGAAPANIIPRYLWGIQPKNPGGSVIRIAPQLANLMQSEVKVPLLKGFVKASFEKQGNSQNYSFEIPANVTAEFQLSIKEGEHLYHDGVKIEEVKYPLILGPGIHQIKRTVQ